MRKYLVIFFLFSITTACDNSEETLEAKKERLEVKKKEYEALQFEINELEKEILNMDPTAIEKASRKLVTAFDVEKTMFKHFIEVQGVAESDLNVTLSTDIGGEVMEIYVKEGESVKKGQRLLKLDDAVIQREIADIRVALELATTVFDRQERLWEQNIGSEMQLLEAKNRKESLEQKLTKAQTQLAKTIIKAPVDGVAENLNIRLGEMANPGYPLLQVVNLDTIKVKADASERHINSVYVGEDVVITFPALDIEREGKISFVGSVINPANRTFDLEVHLPNPDKKLKANLLAIIKIVDYKNDSALVIPTQLVQHDYDSKFVYVLNRDDAIAKAEKRLITTGRSYGGDTEVIAGLSAGEVIIAEGAKIVSHGTLVEPFSTQTQEIL